MVLTSKLFFRKVNSQYCQIPINPNTAPDAPTIGPMAEEKIVKQIAPPIAVRKNRTKTDQSPIF